MAKYIVQLEPNQFYHIWTHANGSENLFRNEENYRYFLKKYRHYIHPIAHTFAYCLMPNHLHLMVKIRSDDMLLTAINLNNTTAANKLSLNLSKSFSNLFNAYTKAYNKLFNRKGSLFIRPFNRKAILEKLYFTNLIAYIHNNPVHHGYASKADEWPFSSHHAYTTKKTTDICRDEAMLWFGDETKFISCHTQLNYLNEKDYFE